MDFRTPLGCLVALLTGLVARAQYDGDNARYRTISLEELPGALARSPNALLIDVRSPGEYSDTSHWTSLNIGHLKGAMNIDHSEVGKRLAELTDHRHQPIYLYCSHSQRSRRVGNLLADSGFTHVVNVNGGMSRYWNEQDRLSAMDGLIERSAGYGILNAYRLCELTGVRPVFFLDVRADSLFAPGKQPEQVTAYGSLKGSKRIPVERLAGASNQLPRDRTIVVVGSYTADAAKAAAVLLKAGFSDVHILFNGLEGMIDVSDARCPCKKDIWTSDAPYAAIGLDQLDTLAILAGEQVVIDIRPRDEYEGKAKDGWANTGRFRIARHIPAAELQEKIASAGLSKTMPLVLVGRGSDDVLFEAARTLVDQGYAKVSILTSGMWGIRWEAHNLPGKTAWNGWVIPYPTNSTTTP
jgi:rhodanese-related sulfurtransferase